VIPVPDEVTDIEAALVEPATVTFHAVRRVGAEPAAIVVVQGAGPIGLLTAQNASNAGAGRIVISEPSAPRREMAANLDFTDVVEPEDWPPPSTASPVVAGRPSSMSARESPPSYNHPPSWSVVVEPWRCSGIRWRSPQ
jgi:threonine dehydrogenase-like Zn-dependent dehydrogenase